MNWFQALTGLPSDRPEVVRAGVEVDGDWLVMRDSGRRLRAGRLHMPALADLPHLPPEQTGRGRLHLHERVGDARALHADPENAGAVFQVASQFNLLEMISPEVTPEQGIAGYATDRTQGPACAMACAAGTIWRNYLMPVAGGIGQSADRQVDTTADLGRALGNDQGALWHMRNGYLLPRPGGLAAIAAAIPGHKGRLRGLLRVGVQEDTEVTLPGAGHLVTQVYASALPVAYATEPVAEWEPFARLVLAAAYEATFRVAAAQVARGGSNRLFLTRLGGGAFGNLPDWIDDAILRAARLARDVPLDVAVVSHAAPNPDTGAMIAAWHRG
ncbi:MAG: hypothetical protein R3D63_14240 [Paracoccaceae bacterium]